MHFANEKDAHILATDEENQKVKISALKLQQFSQIMGAQSDWQICLKRLNGGCLF